MSVLEKYGPHSWDLLAGVMQPEPGTELKGSRVARAGGRSSTGAPRMGWGGGQGPAYVKATLCPGLGKGEEEMGDDGRSKERR